MITVNFLLKKARLELIMKHWIWATPIFIILAMANNAHATDIKKGKSLYDGKCNGCHDTQIHTRPNRIIQTYSDLIGRVKFCDNAAKREFADAKIMDVMDYVNSAFYKCVKEK